MLIRVRMPPRRLVEALDRMVQEGLHTRRSEAKLNAVRRLALVFEEKDPLSRRHSS